MLSCDVVFLSQHQGGIRSSIDKILNPLVKLYRFRALSANHLGKKRYTFLVGDAETRILARFCFDLALPSFLLL